MPSVTFAAATPAFAASQSTPFACDANNKYTIIWGYNEGLFVGGPATPGSTTSNPGFYSWSYTPYALQGATASLTIEATSTFNTADTTATSPNLAFRTATNGYASGVNMGWISRGAVDPGNGGTYTFTFSQTLSGVSFVIGDLDWGAREQVWITSPASFSASVVDPNAVAVKGAGTGNSLATAFYSLLGGVDLDNATSTRGNVLVTVGSLPANTPITIVTSNLGTFNASGGTTTTNENIALTDFKFTCPTWV